MSKQLNEPVLENGIRNTNFFNGRLLTADDLKNEQLTNHTQRWQLGRAIGEGVVEGLMVSIVSRGTATVPPVISITRGVALNRKGQTLALGVQIELALARTPEAAAVERGLFAECDVRPLAADTGTGAYLLVMSPTSAFEDSAPMIGIQPEGEHIGCGRKYETEGVRFSLRKLPDFPPELLDSSPNQSGTLRNRIAHFCYGSHKMLESASDPFVLRPQLSALDLMRGTGALTDCDVPLAVLHWTTTLDFHDLWAVRRPSPIVDEIFHPDQKLVYASVRQFQEHFSTLTNLTNLEVGWNFFFLPPFGRLPLREPAHNSNTGVNLKKFWAAKYKGFLSVINRQELVALLRTASDYAPRRVTAVDTVEVFVVAEHLAAVEQGTETQLYGYYAFGDVARRFCAPARVMRPGIDVKLTNFASTIEGAVTAYHGFRELVLLNLVALDSTITREDAEGLYIIDQVLSTARSIVTAAACGCMSNLCLWTNYNRLASQQRLFARRWLELVLPQNEGGKYPPQLTTLMHRVQSLIESTTFEGSHGLLAALADNDLYEAHLVQGKINQSFNIQVATGAHGSMNVNYTTAPVLPPNPTGAPVPVLLAGAYIFGFTINASIDSDVTLQLTPSISANGWITELWDETADSPRSSDTLPMPHGTNIQRDIRVRVTVPSPGAGVPTSGLLTLDVTETSGSGGVPPGHVEVLLTISQDIPRPDNRVSVSLGNIGSLSVIGSRLTVPRSTQQGFQFIVRFSVSGAFTCELSNANTSQPAWTLLRLTNATINLAGTPGANLAGGASNQLVQAIVQPGPGAQNTDLLFTVRSTNITSSPVNQRFRLSVAIVG